MSFHEIQSEQGRGRAAPSAELMDSIRVARKKELAEYGPKEEPKPARPLLQWHGVGRFLDAEPEPQEFILKDCLPADIVGAVVAAGGTGKTTLLLELGISIATGKPFGPFIPTRPYRVLFIGGEDREAGLHRRIYRAAHALGCVGPTGPEHDRAKRLQENFEAVSLVGEDRILVELDANGNARTSEVYRWLSESIGAMPGVEVLIIDPLSRFFGQNENDSAMASFWVAMLEALMHDHNLKGCLFAHHVSKGDKKDGDVRTLSGRGSTAFFDNARFCMNIAPMTEAAGKSVGVNHADYIAVWISKNNDGPKWASEQYFKRGLHGILEPADLERNLPSDQAQTLIDALRECGVELTRNNLERGSADAQKDKAVKAVRKLLKENHKINPNGIPQVIDAAKSLGLLDEVDRTARGGTIKALVPKHQPKKWYQTDTSNPGRKGETL